MIPGKTPLKAHPTKYAMRTIVGFQPRHSAIPPQTPAMILFLDRLRAML